MNTAIPDLVISYDTAVKLQYAGINAPSLFVYLQDKDGHYFPAAREDEISGIPAYITGELIGYLPGTLQLNNQAYRASRNGWVKLKARDLNYPYAHLMITKLWESYAAGYFHLRKMIAFGREPDGKYRNLLTSEQTEQEALAILLLTLFQEGKYEF